MIDLLDKYKIDDVVGAIPVHLACGIFGTIIVPLTNADTSFVTQFIGIIVIAVFMFVTSLISWKIVALILDIPRPELYQIEHNRLLL